MKRKIAVLMLLLLVGTLAFCGCDGKLVEKDEQIVELSIWSFTSGLANNRITVRHTEENAKFELSVDYGRFWNEATNSFVKTATVNNGETVSWTDSNDVKTNAFIKIVAKVDDNIVGYAVVRVYQGDYTADYRAEVLKSATFPKVNNQYQEVTQAQVEEKIQAAKAGAKANTPGVNATEYDNKTIIKIETQYHVGEALVNAYYLRTFDFVSGTVTDEARITEKEYARLVDRYTKGESRYDEWDTLEEYKANLNQQCNTPKLIALFHNDQAEACLEEAKTSGIFTWKEEYLGYIKDGGTLYVTIVFADGTMKITKFHEGFPKIYEAIDLVFKQHLGAGFLCELSLSMFA